ncbi:SOS response-associated peptidase [Nitrosomonas sp. Nm33]|uniref:SOS response-associated peptidase n=1 Tax=Nitrosomonas sp. Nm33 TaxID=133724 RepID=UPI00089887D1|nr:SOS response-associated peptidase [Nitrosomonas sp. Nm33]SDY44984.1 Putative SOS response-associated peptidase YedK [Nitrosomonas sp. Nm33]
MCGRFCLDYPRASLINWYHAVTMPEIESRYNIAPTTDIVVIRDSVDGRIGSMMRWGLIPHWVKDPKKLPLLFNARVESLAIKPLYKNAFRRQRCIIPASGFYEWKLLSDGKSKKPFYVSAKDGSPLSFAGIWETATIDEVVIDSCTIITTSSNALMRSIHDRMPVILTPETWDTWLTPSDLPEDVFMSIILKPFSSEQIQLWAVSPAVGRISNQGKDLIQPVNE